MIMSGLIRLAAMANSLLFAQKSIKKMYSYNCVYAPEVGLLTIADVEEKHESLKREMRLIRRAIRTQQNTEGLAEKLETLTKEAQFLVKAIQKQREMTYYLLHADSYGGPQ